MSLEEVMAEVRSDRLFYQNSGGGVTLSGGEPLLQWEFATEVLKACKQEGIHTALDTCGYARREVLDHVLEFVDLLLYDIKHLNPEHHRWGTGKSNLLILENARMAAPMIRVWLRFPLIPGYNDAEENLRGLGELAVGLGVEKISLLPYHKAGELKYKRLGRKFPFRLTEPPGERHIQEAKRFLETFGVEVTVGN
jgi:pyruvate formate lyase activating enzyme